MKTLLRTLSFLGFLLVAPSAQAFTTVTATVTWTNPTTGAAATGVKVLRNTDGGAFAQTGTTQAAGTTTFTDAPQLLAHTYCYEIVETNAFGDATPSGQACVNASVPNAATINATVSFTVQ